MKRSSTIQINFQHFYSSSPSLFAILHTHDLGLCLHGYSREWLDHPIKDYRKEEGSVSAGVGGFPPDRERNPHHGPPSPLKIDFGEPVQ